MLRNNQNITAWLIVLTASLFFFYEYLQMNMFNSIAPELLSSFHIGAASLGILSSFYFIANVIFLFLAGILLDRYSTRWVILLSLAVCIAGTALFSLATHFYWACFFRFLTGIGSAFCFLSIIRLASRWFPAHRMALVTGVVVTVAMLGGFTAQTPMTWLIHAMNWRNALQIDAAFGVICFLLILFIVKDYPEHHKTTHHAERKMLTDLGFFIALKKAFLQFQNWLVGLCVCLINLPVGLLGGLWGILYLTHTHPVNTMEASTISSMLFIGTLVGAPIVGWISDYTKRRRPPLFFGALFSLGLICVVIKIPTLSFYPLLCLFFFIGFFTSVQIIGYPLVAENSLRLITAMSVSVVNISVQSGDALLQPFFGYLLDKHILARTGSISTNFIASDFQWAILLLPIGFLLAMLIVMRLPETRCRQRAEQPY